MLRQVQDQGQITWVLARLESWIDENIDQLYDNHKN